MARIAVLGAGVVGTTYASLLVRAGHEVTVVARGVRLHQLRGDGVRVKLDSHDLPVGWKVATSLAEVKCDAVLVAVRGDQLPLVLETLAEHPAPLIAVFSNPLSHRARIEEILGPERLVWCFSGLGGSITNGAVTAHRVRQQPTVLQVGAPRSSEAESLLAPVDPNLRREPNIGAWLDTHNVFIAATAAILLHSPAGWHDRWSAGVRLVRAVRDGFDALEANGRVVTPSSLRAIFGQVPLPIAAAYWARQLSRPLVTVSMAPHVMATQHTEQPAVARRASELTRPDGPYYELVSPLLAPER